MEKKKIVEPKYISEQRKKVINLLKKCKLNNYEKLIEWLDKNNYFTAPASTNFHSNFLGGLVFHSLTVYDLMCEKNSRFNLNLTEKKKTVVIIAGYKEQLESSFFSYNPGLARRFKMRLSIDNYNHEELRQIYLKKLYENEWSVMNGVQ